MGQTMRPGQCIGFVTVLLAAGCGRDDQAHKQIDQGNQIPTQSCASNPITRATEALKSEGTPIQITVETLQKEFKEDVEAALAKYADKTLNVVGVTGGNLRGTSLYLKATEDAEAFVVCFYHDLPQEKKEQMAKLLPNMPVTIRGHCFGYIGNRLELHTCSLSTQSK